MYNPKNSKWLLLIFCGMLGLTGCGGGSGSGSSTPPVTGAAADFSLSATPSSLALVGGGTIQLSVAATAVSGFKGNVAVNLSGLPAGVTASPSPLTVTPGIPQVITLTAAPSATVGQAALALTATAGSLTHTASVTLAVSAAPAPRADFSLTVSPASQSLTTGFGATLTLLATPSNGFSGDVLVTLTGLPAGLTASPSTLTLIQGATQTVTVTAAPSAGAGNATLTFTGVSGSLKHTATAVLSVVSAPPPAPDFLLTIAPALQTITEGSSGSPLMLLVTAANGFTANVAVTIGSLPTGVTVSPSTLTLTPGTAQAVTFTAAASAPTGTATLIFTGTSGSLTREAVLTLTVDPPPLPTGPDVTTYHYDNARDGLNSKETTLTLANVNSSSFGLLTSHRFNSRVDAQPLYVGGLTMNTGTQPHTENVLFVATEHGTVYALNADTGTEEWETYLPGYTETSSDSHGCNQIAPEIGITATPVIDRSYGAHGAIFVVDMSKTPSGVYHQRLHALDLSTGTDLAVTEITASYPGTGDNSQGGRVVFDPGQYAERAGLLLLNGTIYTAWTSHCDIRPYTGWIIGYSESTLQQTTVLNLTPNGNEGSVWMSGFGLGADGSGNIYFLDANGTLDPGFTPQGFPAQGDYGNAILKLSTAGGLAVSDYFEPYNTVAESAADQDLGSGGAMLLPDLKDSSGIERHLLVGAGKDGNIYVGDRDNLGKFNQTTADNSNLYQEIPGALPQGAFSGPAYFNHTVYYAGVADALKAYTITNARLSTLPSSQSATSFAYPGSTPSVSANGTSNAIVWALESTPGSPAVLHAYDATNLGHELYNSNQAPAGRDNINTGNKFITPMVANGHVYVGTPDGVAIFGLLGP